MIVGVTGASGFIGKRVVKKLQDSGHEVKKFVRREAKNDDEIFWSPAKKEIDIQKFQELDAIIHLAGESIAPSEITGFLPFAGGRWSKEKKSRIYWSRKWASDLFIDTFKSVDKFPSIFITASGNNIYGDHNDEVVTETTPYNRGEFLQMVAEECWEEPLDELKKLKVRIVCGRKGLVLGKGNIATSILTLVSKLNLSGPLGSGIQYWSWVSVNDVANAYLFCLENNDIDGPVNITSPEPLQQKEFSKIVAKIMNKGFFAPPVPSFIIKIALGWELGEFLVLGGLRAIPEKLLRAGFEFEYPTLESMKDDFI